MKVVLVVGWLSLVGGLLFNAKHKDESNLPLIDRKDVSLKSSKGIWLLNGNPFTGTLFELSAHGDTLSLAGFDKGREHGTWKTFYRRGKPHVMRQYDHGKKTGKLRAWHENGSIMTEANFKEDEYNGVLHEWDEHGQLLREATYNMGHEEGAQRAWYANGKVRSNYVVLNGRRFGLLGTKNCTNVSDSIYSRL